MRLDNEPWRDQETSEAGCCSRKRERVEIPLNRCQSAAREKNLKPTVRREMKTREPSKKTSHHYIPKEGEDDKGKTKNGDKERKAVNSGVGGSNDQLSEDTKNQPSEGKQGKKRPGSDSMGNDKPLLKKSSHAPIR